MLVKQELKEAKQTASKLIVSLDSQFVIERSFEKAFFHNETPKPLSQRNGHMWSKSKFLDENLGLNAANKMLSIIELLKGSAQKISRACYRRSCFKLKAPNF